MRFVASNAFEPGLLSRRSLVRRMDYDPELPAELVHWMWNTDIDGRLATSVPVPKGGSSLTVQVHLPHGSYSLRRYASDPCTNLLGTILRPPSRQALSLGGYLADSGVATPRPRASLEDRLGPVAYRSYLLTDLVEGTTLYRFIRAGSGGADAVTRLARQVAAIWKRLIELGVSHNDLRPESFLVDPTYAVWLVNVEHARQHSGASALAQLRQRHLDDLDRFFHVRTWRTNLDAVEPFRRALIDGTPLGQWLWESATPDQAGACRGYTRDELASGLSVLVICRSTRGEPGIAESVASVEDIADEIFLVASASSREGYDVLQQLPTLRDSGAFPMRDFGDRQRGLKLKSTFPQQPWLLFLRPGEVATPELVRQLPERIVARTDCDAYRIPVASARSGRRRQHAESARTAEIRLLHQGRCAFSLRGGELLVSVDPRRVGQFSERLGYTPAATWPIAESDGRVMRRAA